VRRESHGVRNVATNCKAETIADFTSSLSLHIIIVELFQQICYTRIQLAIKILY